MHDLLNLIAIIVVFGVCMGLINAFLPMPATIKSLLNILVVVILIIYIFQFFNLINPVLPMIRILR